MVSSRLSPTKLSISFSSIFISSFLDSFSSFIHLAPWLSRMEIKNKRFRRESFIRTLPKNTIPLVTYKGVLLHVCCFFSADKLAVQSKTNVPTRNKSWKRVCAPRYIYLSLSGLLSFKSGKLFLLARFFSFLLLPRLRFCPILFCCFSFLRHVLTSFSQMK
jgi:hypothetical protein